MAALNHCGHQILVIEYIISSSGLTGSCINGRDVCNKSSLSINTIDLEYEAVSVLTRQKIGRGCGEWEVGVTQEKVILCALQGEWWSPRLCYRDTWTKRQWMDGFGQSRELDQRSHALVRTEFIPRYWSGSSSTSLLGYGFLLELISGGDYSNITMVRRNDWHTWHTSPQRNLNSPC